MSRTSNGDSGGETGQERTQAKGLGEDLDGIGGRLSASGLKRGRLYTWTLSSELVRNRRVRAFASNGGLAMLLRNDISMNYICTENVAGNRRMKETYAISVVHSRSCHIRLTMCKQRY